MTDETLVPVFIPALAAILLRGEDLKGSPLTREQVLKIRDSAVAMMLPRAQADKMAESRGYPDIDPENCWYDWQMLRRDMGREPELDAGARLTFSKSGDPAMVRAVSEAQSSLEIFRQMIPKATLDSPPLIKARLAEPNYSANMWLLVSRVSDSGFEATLFEVPSEFKTYKLNDSLSVKTEEILDWMINDNGTLYGGYSLRVQRERLGETEKLNFDRHIGVKEYAPVDRPNH